MGLAEVTLREEEARDHMGLLVVTARRIVREGRKEREKGVAKGAGQEKGIRANPVTLIAVISVTISTQGISTAREVKVGKKLDQESTQKSQSPLEKSRGGVMILRGIRKEIKNLKKRGEGTIQQTLYSE